MKLRLLYPFLTFFASIASAAQITCYTTLSSPPISLILSALSEISSRPSCGYLSNIGSASIWKDTDNGPTSLHIKASGQPFGIVKCEIVMKAVTTIVGQCERDGRTEGWVGMLYLEGGGAVYTVQVGRA